MSLRLSTLSGRYERGVTIAKMSYHTYMATRKQSNSFFRIMLIAISVVLFWRGAWGIMDLYVFPDNDLLSYIVSLVLGIGILFATQKLADELL